MYALDYVDLFNILCLPRAVESSNFQAADVTTLVSNAQAYGAKRRAFMIIDIPESVNEVQDMKDCG